MVNKTANIKEYNRQYREVNRDKLLAQGREYSRDKSDYINGRLDFKSTTGRGFISEMVVAKALGLESGARCNCTVSFAFKYDLLDFGGYNEINVKSSKLTENKSQETWFWNFKLRNKYKPDTYIFIAYAKDHEDIEHVWIIPADADIFSDTKGMTIANSEKGLSRVQEYEVSNTIYNFYLHTMSIDRCSVLKKPDFIKEMLQ